MAWFSVPVSKVFGFTSSSFRCKAQKYTNSCFPCSFHVAIRNLFPKANIPENDAIEDLWETFHRANDPKGLANSAPNEEQVHEYLSRTGVYLAFLNRMKFVSPTTFAGPGVELGAFRQWLSSFSADAYRAMILGEGHATLVFKQGHGKYVNFVPATTREYVEVNIATTLTVEAVEENGKAGAGLYSSSTNQSIGQGGRYVVLLG